jgi:hypothetical protein
MFDLEREFGNWRREMAATGLAPEVLIELEGHLREDVDRQIRSGVHASDALQAALQRIGKPATLRREFDLIGRRGVFETLRRHRWKILLCSGAGLLVAVVLQIVRPAHYQSEAKFLIRYIIAERQLLPPGLVQSSSPLLDPEQNRVMSTEAEILTSDELARRVAEKIGPEKILKKSGGGGDLARATEVVKTGRQVVTTGGSSVIQLAYRHPDSAVSQALLRELIEQYLRMHVEVHRAAGDGAFAIGKVSNITQIKAPSPPTFDFAPLFRMQVLIVGVGVLIGFAWVVILRLTEVRFRMAD